MRGRKAVVGIHLKVRPKRVYTKASTPTNPKGGIKPAKYPNPNKARILVVELFVLGLVIMLVVVGVKNQWSLFSDNDNQGVVAADTRDKAPSITVSVVGPTATATLIPKPISTPTPTFKVLGQTVTIGSVDTVLTKQEFRVGPTGENAAVVYQIAFTNRSTSQAEVAFNKTKIAGVDNVNRTYDDYYVAGQKSMTLCVFATVDWKQYLDVDMFLGPGETKIQELYLNPTGTQGECSKGGVGLGRVPIDTNYVDITLTGLQIRTDQLYQPDPLKWRLQR